MTTLNRSLDPIRDSTPLHSDRLAVAGPRLRLTYAELDEAASRAANAFAGLGLGGKRVGVLLPNLTTFPIVVFGLLRAGARVVMMNPQNSPREIREILADSAVSAVITVDQLRPLLPAGPHLMLVDPLPGAVSVVRPAGVERIDLSGRPPGSDATPDADEEALVVYTAADAGFARGARLSHAALTANMRATVEAMQLVPVDRVLALLPLVHLFGFTVTQNAALAAGASVFPVDRFKPASALELIEREAITVICGVPGVFRALLAAGERRPPAENALRVAICGGSPLPAELARAWEARFGIPLREGYGLTEAGPVCLFNRLDRPNRPGTLGYPFPGVDVSIRDPAGIDLDVGEVGEICVRGPGIFLGYLGEGGRSPDGFHGEWLRTGDLGAALPDGTFRYHGLLKPMFTRNGFNVYPREIERVLEDEPSIAAVTVCSLPDPSRENEIVLFVHPVAGSRVTEEQVRELCRDRLASYKQPGRVLISADRDSDPASRP